MPKRFHLWPQHPHKYLRFLWVFLTLLAALTVWSLVEPYRLRTQREPLSFDFDGPDTPLRVVHFSDIHYDILPRSVWERTIEMTLELKPDLIIVTGDFFHRTPKLPVDEFLDGLRRLSAHCPLYGCLGNHDDRTKKSNNPIPPGHTRATFVTMLLESTGMHVLRNRSERITIHGCDIAITGIDTESHDHNLRAVFDGTDSAQLHLVMAHDPRVWRPLNQLVGSGKVRCDLMMAGHTHGGQLRVPFIGFSVCPLLGVKYGYRLYKLPHFYLNVNPGIVSLRGVRFNCPPEITLLEISGR